MSAKVALRYLIDGGMWNSRRGWKIYQKLMVEERGGGGGWNSREGWK